MQTLVSACPIEDVMRALSGRWPALLLYDLKQGTKRFRDLRRDNPTVSHRILALELKKLEEVGLVSRTEHEGYPRHVDYALTEAGRQLVPIIDGLADWWEASAALRQSSAAPRQAEAQARAVHP
jgi:DNA-binding HxlR family transcriptional regulator